MLDFARRLSRFVPDSELSRAQPRPAHRGPRLGAAAAAVSAGLWAAERSGGLVDPTLVRALERSGYADSLDGAAPASLTEALAAAPARRPARPDPQRALARGRRRRRRPASITRPPGVMLDTGGTGKGLCADAVAHRLAGYTRFVVDCGGDIAVGGVGAQLDPYEIEVEHPLTGRVDRHARASPAAASPPPGSTSGSGATATAASPTTCSIRAPARRRGPGLIGATALGATRARGRDAVEDGAAARARRRARGARRARRRDRPRQRRRRGRSGSPSTARIEASRGRRCVVKHGRADPRRLVAGQPRLGDRRAGADLAVGADGAGDGHQRRSRRPTLKRAVARLHEHVALVALVAIARPRRSRCSATSWLKPGLARDHGPVRDELPAGVHRARDHRRLPRRAARAELLPAPADRRPPLAQAAPRDRASSGCCRAVHTLGAGSDGTQLVAARIVLAPGIPIVYLLVLRLLPRDAPKHKPAPPQPRAAQLSFATPTRRGR